MAPDISNYKPGSIRRVRLHNFLTYADVEFFPGPRLNVVVGPNGTGKSTILCAICLGLGGQPTLLGRADDARTFIMHEKDVATIEIEIVPHTTDKELESPKNMGFNPPHVFKRVIDRNMGAESGRGIGASKYYINGSPTNIKTVKELVQNVYHIQIDNLCTFLPQDKVGSFSGFNSQALLLETEKALLMKWYQTHMNLIELEDAVRREGTAKETIEDRLARLQQENEAIEREKELVEQRQEAEALHLKLKQKEAWVLFDVVRMETLQCKKDKDECKKALQLARETLAPYEEKVEKSRKEMGRMQTLLTTLDREITASKKNYEKNLSIAEKHQDDIEDIIASINTFDSDQKNAERRVKQQQDKVEEAKGRLAQFPPEDEILKQEEELGKEYRRQSQQLNRAKREASLLISEQSELQSKGDQLSQKLSRMNDEKTRRKERIFQQYPELQETYRWIDQNRKLFRRPIHGPIACEVEITDKIGAVYLENHVAISTWKQYVVECREDYNLLYREIRDKRKMNVNIHIVPQGKCEESINRLYSDEKMKMLKEQHGVRGYLDELFVAPPAILQALRTQHNVQSCLVGNQKTEASMYQGLGKILETRENGDPKPMGYSVYTCTNQKVFRHTASVSRFSGHNNLNTIELHNSSRILAAGDSAEQIDALNKEIQELRNQLAELDPRLQAAQVEHDSILKASQQVGQRLKDAKQELLAFRSCNEKVNIAERKLAEFKEDATRDNAAEKEKAIRKLKKLIQNSTSILLAAGACHEGLMKSNYAMSAEKMKEHYVSASSEKVKNKLAEKLSETRNLEKDFDSITRKFNNLKEKLKENKNKAEAIAPMQDSRGNDLPLKAELELLPATIEEIQIAIDEANQKIQSIADNPEVIRQYEDRLQEIAKIKEDIAASSEAHDAKKMDLLSQFKPWHAALMNTVAKVNILFSSYMMELGMAGEVRLAPQAADCQNFKDWGIEILVKFREKAKLQVLSAQVHSGGERSVSTIMYLMALQELMTAPFRCVDEINQGLDERNERLVFKRIVMNSTRQKEGSNHSGQYFLITPKLLPNMTDMEHEDVTILCIFNGQYNFNHFLDWNVDRFLSKKRARCSDESDFATGVSDGENEHSTVKRRTVPRKQRLA